MIVLGKQVGEVWKIPRILGISRLLLPVYPGLLQTYLQEPETHLRIVYVKPSLGEI